MFVWERGNRGNGWKGKVVENKEKLKWGWVSLRGWTRQTEEEEEMEMETEKRRNWANWFERRGTAWTRKEISSMQVR